MELIQTSKDLLYVVIAFCILLISVFSVWLIFYFAMIAKQFLEIIKGVRTSIKKVDETIDAVKEKIEHSTSYLLLIGEGIKKLVEIAHKFSKGKDNDDEDEEPKGKAGKKGKK